MQKYLLRSWHELLGHPGRERFLAALNAHIGIPILQREKSQEISAHRVWKHHLNKIRYTRVIIEPSFLYV